MASPLNLRFTCLEIAHAPLGNGQSIYDYWAKVRGANFAPRWGDDFKLSEIDFKLLPEMSVVDVINNGEGFRYRFWGTKNVETKGFEMTGKLMDEGPSPIFIEHGKIQFEAVLSSRKPLVFVYEVAYLKSWKRAWQSLRLPISDDGHTISKIATYQDLTSTILEQPKLIDEVEIYSGEP
jgi:hypothetical protein